MGFDEKDAKAVEEVEEGAKEGGTIEVSSKPYFEENRKLLQLSEISLWLDAYDDIFSDFDPRPYSERSISDDFLAETKKASKEKTSGKIQLRFLIPKDLQNHATESVIRKRLHEHFRKHAGMVAGEIRMGRQNGLKYLSFGIVMMLTASYLSSLDSIDFLNRFLFVVLEPSGWFITWFGLDQTLIAYKQKKPDLEFYNKMSKSDITFTPY